jgi:hypothetical protein
MTVRNVAKVERGYIGSRYPNGRVYVGVIEDWVVAYPLPHNERHSPDGFEWGYAGSGPADLARSILTHALELEGAEAEAIHPALYQRFKFDKIVPLDRDANWEMSRDEVLGWVAAHRELMEQ